MPKCQHCGKSGSNLDLGKKTGLCTDCLEILVETDDEIMDMLKKGGDERKKALKMIDSATAKAMADSAKDDLDKSPFGVWPVSVHADIEQLERVRRSRSVDIVRYNSTTQTATVQGSSGSEYRTSFKECTCNDFRHRHLPCKHMYKLAADYGNVDFYNHIEFNYNNSDTVAEAQSDISNTVTTENCDSNISNSDINTDSKYTISDKTKRNIGIGVAIAVAICIFCLIGSCSDKNTTSSYTEPTTTITTTELKTDSRFLDECPVRFYTALLEKSQNKYFSSLELSISYSCLSTQDIDKVTILVAPYRYNGEIYESIRSFTIRGPFDYGEVKTEVFKHVWSKYEVEYIEIFAANVYYSDSDVVETYVTPGYIISNKIY